MNSPNLQIQSVQGEIPGAQTLLLYLMEDLEFFGQLKALDSEEKGARGTPQYNNYGVFQIACDGEVE